MNDQDSSYEYRNSKKDDIDFDRKVTIHGNNKRK